MTDIAIPILMYHQISTPPERGTPCRALYVAPERFRRQMLWLKRAGFVGLSLRDIESYLRSGNSGRVVGITFDDGFRNVFANALPVLQEMGFTATNFFVSRQIGGHNAWDENIGMPFAPCMSKAEVREWSAAGNEVGAHTLDHVRLSELPVAAARRQIFHSKFELEDLTGEEVRSFSYPWGDVSDEVRDLVGQAGFTSAVTTRSAWARGKDDELLLPRVEIGRKNGWLATLYKCFVEPR